MDQDSETIIERHHMGAHIALGYVEKLIRKFAEQLNETAGVQFTTCKVIWLMGNLFFFER